MIDRPVGVQKLTLADKAYTSLKARILDSALKPGAKVSIDGLAVTLGFSQTPIREALARLESEGLVGRRPLAGYTVTPLLTPQEFEDLFEIRMQLEPLAARKAAERGPDAEPVPLEEAALLIAPPEADGAESRQLAFAEADARFHDLLSTLSGSAQLARAIGRLDAHLHLYRTQVGPQGIRETEAEHRAVAAAVIAADPAAAEAAMRRHLERAHARYAAAFAAAADS